MPVLVGNSSGKHLKAVCASAESGRNQPVKTRSLVIGAEPKSPRCLPDQFPTGTTIVLTPDPPIATFLPCEQVADSERGDCSGFDQHSRFANRKLRRPVQHVLRHRWLRTVVQPTDQTGNHGSVSASEEAER